jgi:hypothetical protein
VRARPKRRRGGSKEAVRQDRDEYGDGCELVYSLSVANGRYVRTGKSETRGWGPAFVGYTKSGMLEFVYANTMIDWFDCPVGEANTIVAFRYTRAPGGLLAGRTAPGPGSRLDVRNGAARSTRSIGAKRADTPGQRFRATRGGMALQESVR